NFHNVYINPEVYAQYVKTGKFPEKTVLVLDIFKAEEREPRKIVAEGLFPGAHAGVAVAVKNSARPDGSKTDWAYYDFGLESKTAKAFPDKACYDCHLQHADDDNVWVQFYPTLRKEGKGRR
ncbi:MAG: cytochrome P460 family protein, partial [Deltaproteobacteria bacterium]